MQNPYFVQFLADVTGKKIAIPDHHELTGLGVGLLAYRGLGLGELTMAESKSRMLDPAQTNSKAWLKKFEIAVQKSRGTR